MWHTFCCYVSLLATKWGDPNYVVKQSANLSTLQSVISIWTAFSAYCAEKAVCFFV
mgnify:CR=1 FL=1